MRLSRLSILSLLLLSILFFNRPAICVTDEDSLLKGISIYRKQLNLTSLSKNKYPECLADELAKQFKGQSCTNSTGANTVPGTEPQFSNYQNLLTKCDLNVSNTMDWSVMTACVPNLVPAQVLANFTESQYSGKFNDTTYKGIGIGSERDWMVVILTTDTPGGSFTSYNVGVSLVAEIGVVSHLALSFIGIFFFL